MNTTLFGHGNRNRRRSWGTVCSIVLLLIACAPVAAQTRSLGLDVSAWQGNISQNTWNNIHNIENRDFVFIRSSRGGTTGFYNQSDPNNNNGQNTLSQRYDDPYFVQNITRVTNAGMFAGAYHFSRPDIIESTPNSGGIANSGADEADHFIQMAGAWMRPGYLMPVHDFEAGDGIRSNNEMAQFVLDFSDRIDEVMGIRPAIYVNGNYAANIIGGASPSLRAQVVETHPNLWIARWPNQSDPDSIPVQTANPDDSLSWLYGPWDDPPNPSQPWSFWQYASTGRLQSYNNGNSNLDFDVAHGGTEYLKDHLVPALWMNDSSGDWSTLANWNSGQTPVAPVQGPGQVPRVGSLVLPTTRLPGSDDTVILDRPGTDIDVSLTSGSHDIRKLYVRETLNLSGGSLNVNYTPSSDSTPIAAQFSAPVALSAGASLSVHTLQVDAEQTFTLTGGALTFNAISLIPHSSAPAKFAVTGDVDLNPLGDAIATISNGSGTGSSGLIDLGGATRIFNIADGGAASDVEINVPVENGALIKTGAGTLVLNGPSLHDGETRLQAGSLSLPSPLLSDMADVYLTSGATLNLGFAGTADSVNGLVIDGVGQSEGTWGAIGNLNAEFHTPLITGTGVLNVTEFVDPVLLPTILADFNVDEGPFRWSPTFSGSNQNISGDSSADRVENDAFEGAGSQQINVVPTAAGDWFLRHLSGNGTGGTVASPAGNEPFATQGYVGFWLKTTDEGVTVRIALDDPDTADRGVTKEVIADGLWHLYEWNLEDDDQWEAWVSEEGVLTGPTVTLDSVQFFGSSEASILMDLVWHNPDGSLLPEVIAGDFNRDGVVGEHDYAMWADAFGQAVEAGIGADGNGDGVVDAADYTVWRDNMGRSVTPGGASLTASATTPEPSTCVLLMLAWLVCMVTRRTGL